MKRLSGRLLKILIVPVLVLVLAAVAQADSAPDATGPNGDGGHPIVNTSRTTPPIATTVLIAGAFVNGDGTTLKSELLALGTPVVDLFDTNAGTPSVDLLNGYDAVILWGRTPFDNATLLGDNLKAYVDGGGGVVLGTFAWYSPNFDVEGGIQGPGYSPFEEAGPSLYTDACLGSPVHTFPPIMAFVHNACDNFRDNVIVEPGALGLAWWADGAPFVAINHNGNVVGITSYPGDNRNQFFSGQIPQIYYNAANHVAIP